MPQEVGLWRVDGSKPVKVARSGLPPESQLEVMIEADPTILGTSLLLIGRQVPTDYGKFIDLLAVDDEGALHVLELKRDRTPREVVAQVMDDGSWVQALTDHQVRDLYRDYKPWSRRGVTPAAATPRRSSAAATALLSSPATSTPRPSGSSATSPAWTSPSTLCSSATTRTTAGPT